MAALLNLCRVTSSTTGTGSTIAIGAAVAGYLTPALAGAVNGTVYDYAIKDGSASEIGTITYSSTGPQFTGRTVTKSTNSNSAINLSGAAEIAITTRAETLNDASLFTTGTVNPNRLGSGVAGSGAKFLADNSTFQTLTNSGLVSVVAYNSTQTVTIPTGATRCRIYLWGGAGGSGGTPNALAVGLPGAGGGYLEKYLTGLTASNTLAYTHGAAGAGAATNTGNGSAGGNSSLASGTQTITTLTANGGGGGTGNSSNVNSIQAVGGTATNGDFNLSGANAPYIGDPTTGSTADNATGGATGGGRGFGGAGRSSVGGSGGVGRAGSPGGMIIEWYY